VLHSTCTHQGQVDSRLLVVGIQIANFTPGPSFDHNLCCKCLNGSCKAIFNVYISRPFQWYKEYLKARCFYPCNRALKFRESQRTPSSHFWECESHPHTCLKVGLREIILRWSFFGNKRIVRFIFGRKLSFREYETNYFFFL
jgi:hypothetical protein